ncbi:DUF484 family protein [Sphingomonas sp. KRR8]|uniref:DUF484 family protein n=1 Tax=Sphingomonas sp. KRR8 TaxID=2942996 RepID=UPI00201FEA96|nr:DUF484 family protein [Sphingomonas sp. KRR8]URD62183.1 DUF484 family protein [Sphingomonas sp. KRR8]
MAKVIQFEDHALKRLRARVAAAEEANQDLIAFARGHSGAVSSIHSAVLAAMEADSLEGLLHVVVQEWPLILGLDAVALALIAGDKGFRVDSSGIQLVDPAMLQRSLIQVDGVVLRTVERGHPLFGPACDLIRAEALIRLEGDAPAGLIALGQRTVQPLDGRHGSELLHFLGRGLSAMIQRWISEI